MAQGDGQVWASHRTERYQKVVHRSLSPDPEPVENSPESESNSDLDQLSKQAIAIGDLQKRGK